MLVMCVKIVLKLFFYCVVCSVTIFFFFFQAEDGIRDLVRSRGLGDVYKRQVCGSGDAGGGPRADLFGDGLDGLDQHSEHGVCVICLLYTSDAADDLLCVDLGGRRIIKKKNITSTTRCSQYHSKKAYVNTNQI